MTNDVLMQFCDHEAGRYSLQEPWVVGRWRYATDSRIAVRVPTRAHDTQDGKARPSIWELFPTRFPACRLPWPRHDGELAKPECTTCKGTGTTTCRCAKCGMQHERPCPSCGGIKKPLEIAGRWICGTLCQRIQAIGEVRYSPVGGERNNLYFACGKLQGVVAPL